MLFFPDTADSRAGDDGLRHSVVVGKRPNLEQLVYGEQSMKRHC